MSLKFRAAEKKIGSKAKALAAEMRRVFAEDSSVRISRPTAVIRVRDLDEAVTVEEVVAAIAARGVANPNEMRASITRPTNGMGAAWVRCPVTAADDLAKVGRIRVGWSTARVELTAARRRRGPTASNAGGRSMSPSGVIGRKTGRIHATGAG